MGPVIDEEAAAVRSFIALAGPRGEWNVRSDSSDRSRGAAFVGPTVVSGIDRLATDEIFGLVLAAIRVPDFDEAIRVANMTDYKLTAGCQPEPLISTARRDFRVGNLYLNWESPAHCRQTAVRWLGMKGVGSKWAGRLPAAVRGAESVQ